MLAQEKGSALELSAIQLRGELQARPGLAPPLGDRCRAHARVVDVHIEAAPVSARRAPNDEIGTPRAQQPDGAIA
eukprot:10257953-Alexandrium_andersonii.AAC.1